MTTNANNKNNSSRENTHAGLSRISKLVSLLFISFITLGVFGSTLGQEVAKNDPIKAPIVTASITSDGVRIAAPSELVHLRLEVYDQVGQKLFDTDQQGGNVLDWHLQASAGGRVADSTYLCVVTIKNPSGRMNKKLGLVTVTGQSISVRSASVAELSPLQAQVAGPIEGEDQGLAVVPAENAAPMTMVTNTGDEAQLTRTRGPLSFRAGDFFSGNDKEQMRLTEDGNLGLGTSKPQAKLDVNGVVRASDGFMFSDGSTLKLNEKGVLTRTGADGQTLTSVSTSQDKIAKFTDNAGTVGDSVITESGGLVGIGTSAPTQAFDVMNGRIVTTGAQTLSAPGGILEIGTTVTNNDNGASGIRMRNLFNGSASVQQAVDIAPTFAPSASTTLVRGFISTAFLAPPAGVNIANAFGGSANTLYNNTAGSVTNGYGFGIRTPVVFGNLRPANQFGLHIGNQGISGTNNSYGLFVEAQSGSANNYSAIFAGGNVGIGTTAPSSKLEVAGNLKISGAGNALVFPDGTSMTTAASGGAMDGMGIINAINNPATVGTINDSRLSPNLAKLNTPNTFIGNQTVAGQVESTSGGFKFPDGSVQTTSADKVYTTLGLGTLEIAAPGATSVIAQLNLPAGSYMVTASIQFENRGLFNKRLVECQMIDEALWFGRIDGSGGANDYLPVTLHTVISHGGTIRLYCQAIDGGSGHSNVFANARRLTAVRIGDLVTQ